MIVTGGIVNYYILKHNEYLFLINAVIYCFKQAGRNHPEVVACRLQAVTKADPQFLVKAGIVS